MRWPIAIVLFALIIASWQANSSPLVLRNSLENADLNDHWYYLRDPNNGLGLEDVTSPSIDGNFRPGSGRLNFGITSDTIWLRIDIQRAKDAPAEWWLEVAPPYIGEATVYLSSAKSKNFPTNISNAGISLPFSSRAFKARNSTFKIYLDDFDGYVIYLKLRSNSQINVRASVWQPIAFAEKNAFENLLLGTYYGAFLIILVMSVVQWFLKRNKTDLWWMIYLVAEGFLTFRMNGLASMYIFPESPFLNSVAGTASISLMILAGARFGVHAFSTLKEKNKYLFLASHWVGNIAPVIGMVRIFFPGQEMTSILFFLPLVLCLINCVFCIRFLRSGQAAAAFYFIGSWFMSLCLLLVVSRNFGLVPAYEFIDYVWQCNLLLHTALMSIGLVLSKKETLDAKMKEDKYRQNAEFNLNMNLMQKRMIAIVSHEFRNALAMVNVSMHALRKYKDLPAEISERHRNIAKVHHQMRRVIDDFLLEERIQNAEIQLSCSDTKIHILVRDVINIATLMGRGHHIIYDLTSVPQSLYLDEAILRLTLTNLLDNAVKYSPAGSEISVVAQFENGSLKISVIDNGIGMSGYSLTQIFSPHFKVNKQSDGIGLGLHMVRIMIKAHLGDINVSSSVGKGTKVEFYLKIKSREDDFQEIQPYDACNR